MKPASPAFITATLTGLATLGMIALVFLLPGTSQNTPDTPDGQRSKTSTVRQDGFTRKPAPKALSGINSPMTLDRMGAIITRLDNKAEHPRKGFWRFTIEGASVIAVADDEYDRLRILVGIQSARDLTEAQLLKIAQSNFDTALDARYAISQDILWAVYVHPIKSLGGKQFISAIGQTVNLAKSYGDGYSSGGILFEGGDKKDAQRNKLIEKLITKGLEA